MLKKISIIISFTLLIAGTVKATDYQCVRRNKPADSSYTYINIGQAGIKYLNLNSDNSFDCDQRIENITINGGNKNDTISLSGDGIENTNFYLGNGNDYISIKKAYGSNYFYLGDGNDIFRKYRYTEEYPLESGFVDGGDGYDMLIIPAKSDYITISGNCATTTGCNLTNNKWRFNLKAKNIEEIQFIDKTIKFTDNTQISSNNLNINTSFNINFYGNPLLNLCIPFSGSTTQQIRLSGYNGITNLSFNTSCTDNSCYIPFFGVNAYLNTLGLNYTGEIKAGIYYPCNENKETIIKNYCNYIDTTIISQLKENCNFNIFEPSSWFCALASLQNLSLDKVEDIFSSLTTTNWNEIINKINTTLSYIALFENKEDIKYFYENYCLDNIYQKTYPICIDGKDLNVPYYDLSQYFEKGATIGSCIYLKQGSCSTIKNFIQFNPYDDWQFDKYNDVYNGNGGVGTTARYKNVAILNGQPLDIIVKVIKLKNMPHLYNEEETYYGTSNTPKGFKLSKMDGNPYIGFYLFDQDGDPTGTRYEATLQLTLVKHNTNTPVTGNFEFQVWDIDNFEDRTEYIRLPANEYSFYQLAPNASFLAYREKNQDTFQNKLWGDNRDYDKRWMIKLDFKNTSTWTITFGMRKNEIPKNHTGRAGFNLVFGSNDGLPSCEETYSTTQENENNNIPPFVKIDSNSSSIIFELGKSYNLLK